MPARAAASDAEDNIAASVARVVEIANKKAREEGWDVAHCLINVSQRQVEGKMIWFVNYGPCGQLRVRGGDLIVEVDPKAQVVRGVMYGQ